MSVAGEIQEFILREVAPGQDIDSLQPEADLLASDVIDSLGIVQLISFLEDRYAIKVDDDDLAPENFRSVESIVQFVEAKRAQRET